jgi:hypothetical protein
MTTTQTTGFEPEPMIDALLSSSEPVSIIDGLLDLPGGTDDAWERMVRARLEARLVERMRHTIEKRPSAG